jgi:hypothetical protein
VRIFYLIANLHTVVSLQISLCRRLNERLVVLKNNAEMAKSSLKALSMQAVIKNVEIFTSTTAHQHRVENLRKHQIYKQFFVIPSFVKKA